MRDFDPAHRRKLDAWVARHLNRVTDWFYKGGPIVEEAQIFSECAKLAQGLIDQRVLNVRTLRDIANQIPGNDWHYHLFWIARDSMPRAERPLHYSEEHHA